MSIAKALVAAQKAFAPALKTSLNPHFKNKYAALDACVEAVIDALNSNGIALTQKTRTDEGGVIVETIFLHESGETFSGGELRIPCAKQDPQGYGSALTYARRYSLMAACGIAPEDDDGRAAGNSGTIELTKETVETLKFKLESCENIQQLQIEWGKLNAAERAVMAEVKDQVKAKFK